MPNNSKTILRSTSPYNAAITREQFLFYEVRTTAKLLCDGLSPEEVVEQIVTDNLFQYPTEKSVRKMALACLRRLDALQDEFLVQAIATQPADVAKQICLYAMMKQYRLVWDFMITVIGEKYRSFNSSFTKMDLNVFFMQLAEQDDYVASWSNATIQKIKSVLVRVLVENEYLDNNRVEHLNPVLISKLLEQQIRANNDTAALVAFNCLG